MAVKFNMPHTIGSLYVEGDIAKFDVKVEEDLIKRDIADKFEAKKAPEPKPAA